MLLPATPQFRKRRSPRKASATAPPIPSGLTLLSASFDAETFLLRLVFDRAIDATGLIFEAFLVADAQTLYQYLVPNDISVPNPTTVELIMGETEPLVGGSGVHLNVSEGNGIVAAADGEPWLGCSNLALPFG